MKGFVPTPSDTVDFMVNQLFRGSIPTPAQMVLDPGCGDGALVDGIIRWCAARGVAVPRIVGVDSDARLVAAAREKFKRFPSVHFREADFLIGEWATYDFIIGNPPYVPITGLTPEEKDEYRSRYQTAQGRFDLYLLFFEQALKCLRQGGRLVFITPEKFLYVESAAPLRRLLSQRRIEEVRLVKEDTFGHLITYPTVTTLTNAPSRRRTSIVRRDGETMRVSFPADGSSWLPTLHGAASSHGKLTLADVCTRVSCGVATGADAVFVSRTDSLSSGLRPFAYPTIAGRELHDSNGSLCSQYSMLLPYSEDGELLQESQLGALKPYLHHPSRRAQLLKRTCVHHKPWYAFHETPPLAEILLPKILCKDITARPRFWINLLGDLVPRHSVYYIVPKNSDHIEALCTYLNSNTARAWLVSHCQRAANGFLRLQSHVLKQLPVPAALAAAAGSPGQAARRRVMRPARRPTGTPQLTLPLRLRDANAF